MEWTKPDTSDVPAARKHDQGCVCVRCERIVRCDEALTVDKRIVCPQCEAKGQF